MTEMDVKELNKHEEAMKEKNAWCIAQDLVDRIDGEPGPGGGFMRSFVTDKKGKIMIDKNENSYTM